MVMAGFVAVPMAAYNFKGVLFLGFPVRRFKAPAAVRDAAEAVPSWFRVYLVVPPSGLIWNETVPVPNVPDAIAEANQSFASLRR